MDLITAAVVLIAALPGLVGLTYSLKLRAAARKRGNDPNLNSVAISRATDAAIRSMESQLRRLNEDSRRASIQRDVWELDRRDLTQRIELLTERVNTLQAYVTTLTTLLDAYGIDRPKPPE